MYVERLVPPGQVPLVAGVLFSVAAVFAALGHWIAAPMLDRWSPRVLIAGASLTTAAGLGLIIWAPSVWAFAVALAAAGAAIGVGMTAAYTSGGALLPPDAHATGFGLMMTASLIGLAASPILAGLISGPELRIVFEADVVLMLALAAGGLGVDAPRRPSLLLRRPPPMLLLPERTLGLVLVTADDLARRPAAAPVRRGLVEWRDAVMRPRQPRPCPGR